MSRRHGVGVVALLVLIGGCAGPAAIESAPSTSPPATTSPRPEPWAHEAVDFFEALDVLPETRADWFYAPSVERNPILERPSLEWWAYQHVRHARRVFLARDGAVVLHMPLGPHATPSHLRVFEISDGLITDEKIGIAPVRAFSGYAIPRGSADRLEALYAAYLAAWESRDQAGIDPLYVPHATRRDGLFESASLSEAPIATGGSSLTMVGPAANFGPLVASSWRDPDPSLPAVFTAESTLTADSVTSAYAVFRVHERSDCDLQVMAVWELEDFVISAEEILYERRSLRRCAEASGLELPGGWWTDLEVPDPFAEIVTTSVAGSGTNLIKIANGSAVQASLVEWAVGRIETAGLEVPPALVIFPPAHRCLNQGVSVAILDPADPRITICLEDEEVCEEDPQCRFGADAQRIVLHEFGHLWLERHVDERVRQEFLELRGLQVWLDQDRSPFEQGIEQAADILAWGLSSELLEIHIPDTTPEDLTAGFRLLTGADPIAPRP